MVKSIDTVKPPEPADDMLTPKQELFCQYYCQPSSTFSNGVWSYALAYGFDLANADKTNATWDDDHKNVTEPSDFEKMRNVCGVNAHRLLRNAKIINRVKELRAEMFDDDAFFDSKLVQIAERGKDTDAIAAIKHRNDLKQRVTKKIDANIKGDVTAIALVEFIGEDDEDDAAADGQSHNTDS